METKVLRFISEAGNTYYAKNELEKNELLNNSSDLKSEWENSESDFEEIDIIEEIQAILKEVETNDIGLINDIDTLLNLIK